MALTHAIKKMRSSIFQIQIWTPTFQHIVVGTGFAVDESGIIVTANHVVKALEHDNIPPGSSLKVGFAGPDYDGPGIQVHANFKIIDCEVIAQDIINDIALLKVNSPLNQISVNTQIKGKSFMTQAVTSVLDVKRPLDGEDILISGYPLSEPSLVSTSGIIASNWTLDNGNERYLADVTANRGNSGGPVYMPSLQKVIGVCVAGKTTDVLNESGEPVGLRHTVGLTYIVPSSFVKNLLNMNV